MEPGGSMPHSQAYYHITSMNITYREVRVLLFPWPHMGAWTQLKDLSGLLVSRVQLPSPNTQDRTRSKDN